MDYFKAGMAYLIAYAEKFNVKKPGAGYFSFPHLNREKNETPGDKLIELWEYCSGTKAKKGPEEFFNRVFETLNKSIEPAKKGKGSLKTTGHEISTAYIPFVDEFLANCIYRDEFYTPAEAEKLLPILETVDELCGYAKYDAKKREMIFAMDAFQSRLGQLIKALRMAKKFDVEFGMSY